MTDRLTVDQINSDQLDHLYDERDRLQIANRALNTATVETMERAETAEAERDGAYRERAHLVALLTTYHPAAIAPALDLDEVGWWIVYLTIGGRQCSWHISPRDAGLFAHVERVEPEDPRAQWDGHTTDAKYAWLRELTELRAPAPDPAAAQVTEPGHVVTVGGNPAAAHEAVRQMDADTSQPHTGLVVQPYRDHGKERWVFRCWGTGTCDGLLSLDHTSQQSAEHARDRHVREEHPSEEQH